MKKRPKTLQPAEAWCRKHHPKAFVNKAEKVFRYTTVTEQGAKVETDVPKGIASDVLFAKLLAPAGSPECPVVWIPESEKFAEYSPKEGIYQIQPPAKVDARVFAKMEQIAFALRRDPAQAEGMAALRNVLHGHRVREGLKAVGAVPESAFEYDRRHLHVQDGVLDLQTGKLLGFTPDLRQLTRTELSLQGARREPTEFLAMLERMLSDAEDRRLLLDCMAQSLVGNPHQWILVIIGGGGTGKSTLINLWMHIVGQQRSRELRLAQANERFESAKWEGMLLLHVSEATTAELEANPRVLKQLSGQDRILAERKYSNTVTEFTSFAMPVLTANGNMRIPVDGDLAAWQRRIKPVLVDGPPPANPMPGFVEGLLRREGGAILWYLCHRLKTLRESQPRDLTAAQYDRLYHMLGADPVRLWVHQNTERAEGSHILVADVVAAITPVLRARGECPPERVLQERLRHVMKEVHGASRSNSVGGRRGFRHVRLTCPG